MKILALLMLTTNIVFFLWQYHIGAVGSDQMAQAQIAKGLQVIVLASEVPPESEHKTIRQAKVVPFDYLNPDLQRITRAEPVPQATLIPLIDDAIEKVEPVVPAMIPVGESRQNNAMIAHKSGEQQVVLPKPVAKTEKAVETTKTLAKASSEIEASKDKVNASGQSEKPDLPQKTENFAVCYKAGPFTDDSLFQRWHQQTGIAVKFIKSVWHEEQEIGSYLVYYPAPANFEQALANVEMLKAKGITDYWLFRDGESKGDISLGLFKNEARARVLKQQLSTKGVAAMIRPRYKVIRKLYAYINIAEKYEDKLIASRILWQQEHPEFAIIASDCVTSSESATQRQPEKAIP